MFIRFCVDGSMLIRLLGEKLAGLGYVSGDLNPLTTKISMNDAVLFQEILLLTKTRE